MALYRREDQGEPVRDIQDRLSALGFDTKPDLSGEFGAATEAAVRSFQEARSLAADGLIGRETWRALVDAGFVLGDRQLYYRMPMLHGDDVAELQRCLNAIGFDAGDVDGILGPDTLRGLLDFQQNRRLAEDGIAGPLVVRDLRLMSRETSKMGRHEVRERAWLASLPPTLAGSRVFVDPFCRTDDEAAAAWRASVGAGKRLRDLGAHVITSRSSDTRPAERLRALHANERAVDLVIAFAHPATDRPGIYSFASPMSHSEAGAAIARGLAPALGLEPLGRVMPILRETRSPAVVIASDAVDQSIGDLAAISLERWLGSQAAARARA
ncbi:MAG: peptidoglycan-binding protein [Acidimicrobiia bacterium]